MKVSVTSYSYSQAYSDQFTIFDAMDHAKAHGADGFEFAGFDVPEGMTKEDRARDLSDDVERACREVDIAEILGAPVMRHDVAWGFPGWYKGVRTFSAVLPRIAEGCRRVTEYAEKRGIRTCTENHGFFAQDADRIVALVTEVGNPNYGALCDMGNFLCADDNSAIAVGKVAPFPFHVHAKDCLVKSGMEVNPGAGWFASRGGNYLRGTIIGHGMVPVAQDIKVLKAAGYDGYVTVEFEGMEKTLQAIEIGIANLKRFIG